MSQCTAMSGSLYIIATPIGNLEDITQRALRLLAEVDLIACEDTRRTRTLLNHFGIKTKTISYHEHNERERAAELLKLIEQGKDIGLVSDAGTPLLSDPGFRVVNLLIDAGVAVIPVPGPSAALSALVGSGLPPDQFFFGGFLPARANARRTRLQELRDIPATLLFYESPQRIAASLKDAMDVFGDREAVVARELTKLHEEFARGRLGDLAKSFAQRASIRGEIVLLINGARDNENQRVGTEGPDEALLIQRVQQLESEGLDQKSALKRAARELGLKRAEAYRLMVAQKNLRTK